MSIIHRRMPTIAPLLLATAWLAPSVVADHQDALAIKGQRQVAVCSRHCNEDHTACIDSKCAGGINSGQACSDFTQCPIACEDAELSWYGSEGQLLEKTGPVTLDPLEIIEVEYSGPEIFLWCARGDSGGLSTPAIILYDRNSGVVDAMSFDSD